MQWSPPVSDDEEDEDMVEIRMRRTVSRFPAGFPPMRMCRWYPAGWGCMFAHDVNELHPPPPPLLPMFVVKGLDDIYVYSYFLWLTGKHSG